MFVFINPGHAQGGMPDPGAVNMEANLRECDIAITVGSLTGKYLEEAGCKVKLLQSHNLAGESPGYPNVTETANISLVDVFLSIHVNAGGGLQGCISSAFRSSSKHVTGMFALAPTGAQVFALFPPKATTRDSAVDLSNKWG